MRYYAIGDTHGELVLAKQMVWNIVEDRDLHPTDGLTTIWLGDYVDRGPYSKQMISFLMGRTSEIKLKGNHEAMMVDAYRDDRAIGIWWVNGGQQTLQSYGMELKPGEKFTNGDLHDIIRSIVPVEHIEFMDSLPLYHETDTHFFVHAGINKDRPLNDQKEKDLLWIREYFLKRDHDVGKHVVHGHTPDDNVVKRQFRTGLDTGACFRGGKLSCGVFEGPGGPKRILEVEREETPQGLW